MTGFRFAALTLSLSLWFAPQSRADSLDHMSFRDLAHFVEFEATAKDISGLAQRQFYFSVENGYEAQADDYSALQQAIARRIPVEFARPVFDVRFIFGDKKNVTNDRTVGILGGTGPLSDANITRLIMQELKFNQLANGTMIHLFSLPPPRTTKDQILSGVTYTARLTAFVRHGYAEYFLASNTAHLNISKIETLSGSKHINNLPRIIADRIAADQAARGQPESILILGTRQAWEGRLYDAIFDEKHMAYAAISSELENQLQNWIDRIKQGLLSDDERLQLKAFIVKLGHDYKTKDLLLSCTELPLGLGDLLLDLANEGFVVYDTEGMIASIIAEKTENLKP